MEMSTLSVGNGSGIGAVFASIAPGRREARELGLTMLEGVAPVYRKGYLYVEIPVNVLINLTEDKEQDVGLRNQLIQIKPACTINLKGNSPILIEPNPELSKYGNVQGSYLLTPGVRKVVPVFNIHLLKTLNLTDISYSVRIYKFN